METENKTHKVICHDCSGNGYRRDCYGEVYQCKNCKSQGEIAFTEEEILENIDAELPSGVTYMNLKNHKPNYWLLLIIVSWLLLIMSIIIYK